jgi:hypothetical protein
MHLKEFFKTKENKSVRKKPSSKNNKTKKNN